MKVVQGFRPNDRARVAALYWDAFGDKLGKVMGPAAKGRAFVERVARQDHAICAYDGDTLLGVVGFKTHQGAFVGGTLRDLAAIYGWFGCLWRAALLSMLERDVENERFLMDGIFVVDQARGRGVGTALLDAVAQEATARGFHEIRLDVIDKNARARSLYERRGYRATKEETTGPLRYVFGFSKATTMVRDLS